VAQSFSIRERLKTKEDLNLSISREKEVFAKQAYTFLQDIFMFYG
jgi:hypothetical protein